MVNFSKLITSPIAGYTSKQYIHTQKNEYSSTAYMYVVSYVYVVMYFKTQL